MERLICIVLLALSISYAVDENRLEIECRDFQDAQACKKFFFYYKSLCDKGDDRGCFNVGTIYFTGRYGVVKNGAVALEYFKPLCDKGYSEAETCHAAGLIYSVTLNNRREGNIYLNKACKIGNKEACKSITPSNLLPYMP